MSNTNYQPDDKVRIGASWYPEMWPSEEWPKDIARMKELGFNMVRLFEFAWHRFEPEEGKYGFDWAIKIMDQLAEAGIGVQVGTPTAAPPAWLTSKYPEVLQTKVSGVATHGMRKHYNHHSRKYRKLCADIVSKMVEAFAGHPALHSWQIDNEMAGRDFSEETRGYFHEWLKDRYGTIEKLNETWGLEFWSQAYDSFEQIPMPTASVGSIEVPERHHPSLIMAIARFNNDGWTDYIRNQVEIIRKGSDKPITSNMTGGLGMHWFQHNRLFDAVGHSLYKDVDHYDWNVMYFDRMRAEKNRPYWFLETAPNWSGGGRQWNIHHNAKGVQAISWLSTALGGSMTLFWQWRQHWAGQEMQHGTHVTATGKWRPNVEAWKDLASQYAEHSDWLMANPPQTPGVAIMLSNEAAWGLSIDPIDEDMQYLTRWRDDYYQPLVKAHVWRDVIDDHADLSRYQVLLLPLMPIVPKETMARIKQWVRDGGRLLLGPLTGYRTEEFTCPRDQEFNGLEELIGAESSLRFTVQWQEKHVEVDFTEGVDCPTRNWCEGFKPTTGEPIAFYKYDKTGGYGDGEVAAVQNSYGEGTVITLGCQVDPASYLWLVDQLMMQARIEPVAYGSDRVIVVPRSKPGSDETTGYALVNIAESKQLVTIPTPGGEQLTDALTGREVGPDVEMQPLEVMLLKS